MPAFRNILSFAFVLASAFSLLPSTSAQDTSPTPNYESLMEPYYLYRQRYLGTEVSSPSHLDSNFHQPLNTTCTCNCGLKCTDHQKDPNFYACCHPLPVWGTPESWCTYTPQDGDPCNVSLMQILVAFADADRGFV